jgi:ribosome-binding ATPase YchF (GTP1/OBG family)
MKTAIIGLPMVGKTSLFTILTGVHQDTRIGSTSVRMGVAKVPDTRLEALGRLFEPPKVTYATVEYVDMPAISKESLRDAGSVANLRVVDAFAHVLRLFASDTIPHEKGSVDPLRDLEDLDRKMDDLIRSAGFELTELRTEYAHGPRAMTYIYEGCARPRPLEV